MRSLFVPRPVEEDRRPFWARLFLSLRPDFDLKRGQFWIKGEAKF
jgi:hypothetical protein